MSSGIADWLWYATGGGVAFVGLVLAAWAIFWDRARGRFRCPKCWYDMQGRPEEPDGLTCPECGRRAKSEKKLRKTRRRKRWSAVGLLILLVGFGIAVAPKMKGDGWVRYSPNTVLIFRIPNLTAETDPEVAELDERWVLGIVRFSQEPASEKLGLWWWQRKLLVNRCIAALEDDRPRFTREFALRLLRECKDDASPAVERLRELYNDRNSWVLDQVLFVFASIGPGAAPAVPDLIDFLSREPVEEDWQYDWHLELCIEALGAIGPEARDAVPLLTELVENPPDDEYRRDDVLLGSMNSLGRIGPDAIAAVPVLIQVAENGTVRERLIAVTAIGQIDAEREDSREAVLDALLDGEVATRNAAASITRNHDSLLTEALSMLTEELLVDDAVRRMAAARGLMSLGPDARPAIDALRRALPDEDKFVSMFAAKALEQLGESASPTGNRPDY